MNKNVKLHSDTVSDAQNLNQRLAAFQFPSRARSIWQLANTLVPYALIMVLAYYAMQYSYWLALPLLVLGGGFLIRSFIIFHDCGHRAFFRSRRANDFWGRVTGIITFTPYYYWRRTHAEHHATSGNLDKRGHGDVWTMTVAEYMASPRLRRLQYRLYRNPIFMFLLGPLYITLITHRMVRREANAKDRWSVYGTNVGIAVLVTGISLVIGWKSYLAIQLPILLVGLVAGIWLFYVQHQFEGVYWAREKSWDFVSASLEGGSFYDLPLVLRWFTGSIGYHHVHHLNPRIPNYNLAKCHEEVPTLQQTAAIGIISSLRSLRFRFWDEERGRLIGVRELDRSTNQSEEVPTRS